MLEKMGEFFDNRLDEYDSHQLSCIEGAKEFYPLTASLLPKKENCRVLDLGCGTGLELREYAVLNSSAEITGIDMAPGMLSALRKALPEAKLKLSCDSYLTVPFGEKEYDAAVSVESIHHFDFRTKCDLYKKLFAALKDDGYFILTDYFASDIEAERANFEELERQKSELCDKVSLYHFDTPLTLEHELEALKYGGFTSIETVKTWSTTAVIRASKS